jgi:hypothetical protein
MSTAIHCDREDCPNFDFVLGIPQHPFVGLVDLATGNYLAHACCPDCLMHWIAANTEPSEEHAHE